MSKNCFFNQPLDSSFPLFYSLCLLSHTHIHTHAHAHTHPAHTIAKSNKDKKCSFHVLLHRAIFGQPKNTSLRIGLSGIGVNLSGDMDN